MSSDEARDIILISHANPEDNTFARWLAARLTMAGYRAWVDVRSLRGGDDFWQVIEQTLRRSAVKQIVVVSDHTRKSGVMKELALGDYVGKQLNDPSFMIPIRVTPVPFGEFPPELLRRDAFDAFPNWAAVLGPLIETLQESGTPRIPIADSGLLSEIVAAQELGRKAVVQKPESLYSNWFPVAHQRPDVWLMDASGTFAQLEAWSKATSVPHARFDRSVVSLCPLGEMAAIDDIPPPLKARACLPFNSVVEGRYQNIFPQPGEARKLLTNLLRQHWDWTMHRRGLRPVEFASGQKGWFFPDGLIEGPVKRRFASGQRISRVLSGKFKDRRWHLCLVAQPKLRPEPFFRIHANVAVTANGVEPLPGDQLQRLRLRLTRSWWNDKWRDMLLAAMGWLAETNEAIALGIASEPLEVSSTPISFDFPVSFTAEEERVSEEAADGTIELSLDLETEFEDELAEDAD